MSILYSRWFLASLVAVNLVGTVWGFDWYWHQLLETPWYFLPVVPDSPLHAMLFGIFILWLLRGRLGDLSPWRQFLAWAGVLGTIKYGLWTTVILSQYLLAQGIHPSAQDWMLFASHGGMALQGFVYMTRLPKADWPAALVILWLAVNDFFDYVFMTHPYLPLANQTAVAGWAAISLTLLVALTAFGLLYRGRNRAACPGCSETP